MTLDADLKKVIENYENSNFSEYSSLTPTQLRQHFNDSFYKRKKPNKIDMEKVHECIIPGPDNNKIKLRIYYPSNKINGTALMYFHGGGFVIRDDMDIYDHTCRLIAKKTGCVVIAVDFRLAPEHPFPAASEDCYAATLWVSQNSTELNINPNKLGVWGESCGGNLSAVVALMAKERGKPALACQILISPMLDINFNTESYQKYNEGYILTRDSMKWFWSHYFAKEEDKLNPFAIPIKMNKLERLPPALIVTTEYDVLRDEGELYAKRLKISAVSVDYCCYEGLIHGFFDLYHNVSRAKAACDDILIRAKNLMM